MNMSAPPDPDLVGGEADLNAHDAYPPAHAPARFASSALASDDAFLHEAALYAGVDGFLDTTLPFIGQALSADEPLLVAVSREKIEELRTALDGDARKVRFVDMAEIGPNPARIIPVWLNFVAERPNGEARVWGIGEPIGPDRTADVLVECQLHELLLNVAFADTPRFSLLCPYDTDALDPSVIDEAHRSHPLVRHDGVRQPSASYRDLAEAGARCELPLTPPPLTARELPFNELDWLPAVRRFVQRRAQAAGLSASRTNDLVLAVNEVVANSLVHGGGSGLLRIWLDRSWLVCEVSDSGRIEEPLVGRRPPGPAQNGGWGLWLANQLCELVQVRSYHDGNVVRLKMSLDD
jgi:anti-sigma regulatory factor (Ser/Thr protein kinase)